MNLKHRNIKFTFETEDSNNFSFLDIKIIRKSKQFVTPSFRKATFSGVFTNYDSFICSSHASVLDFQNLFQYGKFSYRSRTPEKYFQM